MPQYGMIGSSEVDAVGTKQILLSLLQDKQGTYVSGEEIAKALSVTRTAIWKVVHRLRDEGYRIDAVPNKGYRLPADTDILSVEGIQKHLQSVCTNLTLTAVNQVESTNTLVREKAAAGAPEGYAVIANSQTGGKGRMGRRFFSPSDTGLYISLLLRPVEYSAQQAVAITTMAAVAVSEAIESVSGEKAGIKWVNDVYLHGKKVCGILTEASFGMENGAIDYAVVGVGVNMYPPENGFPEELKSKAGTVLQSIQKDGKNRLAATFLNRFMEYYTADDTASYVDEYRSRSIVIGREVTVLFPGHPQQAVALDVDGQCRLLVQYPDGSTERLSSGEISIRL